MNCQQFFAKYKEIQEKAEKFYDTNITFPWPKHTFDGFEIEENGIIIKYSSFHCYQCKNDIDNEYTKFATWEELGIDFNETPSIIIPKEMRHG